jgi:hypothetical protein
LSETVQAFYMALGAAHGEEARKFVVPEKGTSGAFSPNRKVERFGWTFAPGDKVMQIENDYFRVRSTELADSIFDVACAGVVQERALYFLDGGVGFAEQL